MGSNRVVTILNVIAVIFVLAMTIGSFGVMMDNRMQTTRLDAQVAKLQFDMRDCCKLGEGPTGPTGATGAIGPAGATGATGATGQSLPGKLKDKPPVCKCKPCKCKEKCKCSHCCSSS